MSITIPYFIILLASLVGFILASVIYYRKRHNKVVVCPIRSDCNMVLHSSFSRFFGVPVEIFGMGYYALIFFGYLYLSFLGVANSPIAFWLFIISTSAFLFSLYLTYLQAFTIKQWCLWCLFSANLCSIILLFGVIGMQFDLTAELRSLEEPFLLLRLFGIALGLGVATVADFLLFRFLKDLKISILESEVLNIISNIVWFCVGVIAIGSMAVYIPNIELFGSSAFFVAQALFLLVIIINASILNLFLVQKLIHISLGKEHEHSLDELVRIRRRSVSFGAISIVSWYSLFIFELLPMSLPSSYPILVVFYLIAIVVAILVSKYFERLLPHSNAV